MGGRSRPRPLNQVSRTEPANVPSANEDPSTAPRIPLGGRSSQQRSASGGHRRANSEWASAATINQLYPGRPSPTLSGQVSPGLVSPPMSLNPSAATRPSNTRVTSNSTIPTISESGKSTNRAQRDSKFDDSRESRYSVVSDGGDSTGSPPQSTTSSGDRPSQAIMAGNKMRPLRLVQEAKDGEAAKKAANRGSWIGWFGNKGANGAAPAGGVPGQ